MLLSTGPLFYLIGPERPRRESRAAARARRANPSVPLPPPGLGPLGRMVRPDSLHRHLRCLRRGLYPHRPNVRELLIIKSTALFQKLGRAVDFFEICHCLVAVCVLSCSQKKTVEIVASTPPIRLTAPGTPRTRLPGRCKNDSFILNLK